MGFMCTRFENMMINTWLECSSSQENTRPYGAGLITSPAHWGCQSFHLKILIRHWSKWPPTSHWYYWSQVLHTNMEQGLVVTVQSHEQEQERILDKDIHIFFSVMYIAQVLTECLLPQCQSIKKCQRASCNLPWCPAGRPLNGSLWF